MEKESSVQDYAMSQLMNLQPAFMYWRNNTGAVKMGNRFVRFGLPGSPDILGCYKGLAIGIECKSSKGKQRQEQVIWQKRWEQAGGKYYLVNSTESVHCLIIQLKNL